jgi:hypothetical protein
VDCAKRGVAMTEMDDDEQIPEAILNVAIPAQQLLTAATALGEIHGPAAVRSALIVAFAVYADRTLGRAGTIDELRDMVVKLLEEPVIMGAVSQWLH